MLKLPYVLFRTVLRILFRSLFTLTVSGTEHIPREGGAIIAANHRSYLDPLVLCAALRRPATFIAMQELFNVFLVGPILRPYCIPVDRGRPVPSTVKDALSGLRKGKLVVIFPEGGIRAEGGSNDLKRGMLLIARLSGAPVIPARIEGTDRAMPPASRIPRLTRLSVLFSAPLAINGGASGEDMNKVIAAAIAGSSNTVEP